MSDKNATFDNAAKASKANIADAFNRSNFNLNRVINKSIGQYSSKKENGLFMAGLGSIVFGSMVGVWFPDYEVSKLGFYALGGITMVMNFIENIENKWDELFTVCRLFIKYEEKKKYPILLKKKKTDYGYILKFKAPIGITSKDFKRHQTAIEEMLGNRIEISFNNFIFIKVFEKGLQKEYPYKTIETKGLLEIPIGYAYGEKLVTIDMKEAVHLLIAGETDSGKSTILRNIITYLITMKKVTLHLCDLKGGTEFKMFERCKGVKHCARTKDDTLNILKGIYKEVDRRNKLFYDNDCINIYEYNKKYRNKRLKHEIVIIDEFAVLRKDKKGSVDILETLGAVARSTGIHLIISTQRPSADVVTGLLKANFPGTIGLKTHDDINSRIVIDHSGLETLRGYGHGIVKIKSKEVEMQSLFLKEEEARNLVRPYYRPVETTIKKSVKKNVETIDTTGEIKDFSFLFRDDSNDK